MTRTKHRMRTPNTENRMHMILRRILGMAERVVICWRRGIIYRPNINHLTGNSRIGYWLGPWLPLVGTGLAIGRLRLRVNGYIYIVTHRNLGCLF